MYIGYNQDKDDRVAEKAVKRKVKIAQIQSAALSTQIVDKCIEYVDLSDKCYPINGRPPFDCTQFEIIVDDHFRNNFPSFTYYDSTNMVCLSDKDLSKFLQNAPEHVLAISKKTNQPLDAVCDHLQGLAENKKIRVQPTGFANICHKALNLGYASAASVKPALAVAKAHMQGLTGFAFLQGNVAIIFVYVPFTSAIIFATAERLTANTPFGSKFGMMRDFCLIPTRFTELVANDLILKHLPIDIRFNVSDYLKFGTGYPLADIMSVEKMENWWGKLKEIVQIIKRPS